MGWPVRLRLSLFAAVAVVIASCGSATGVETTTSIPGTSSTSSVSTTTSTSEPTTTSTSTTTSTTSTSTTTTTTMPPPIPVQGWDSPGPDAVRIEVEFDYVAAGEVLKQMLEDAVDAMGIVVTADASVELVLDANGTALSSSYGDIGVCYSGARVRGELRLSDETGDEPTLAFDIRGDVATPFVVMTSVCEKVREPEDAPFDDAFEPEMMEAIVEFWGSGSIPYLVDLLRDERYRTSIRTLAVQHVRLMDWDEVSPEAQFEILDAVLWYAARTTYQSSFEDIDRYREAASRLFIEAVDMEVDMFSDSEIAAARRTLEARY